MKAVRAPFSFRVIGWALAIAVFFPRLLSMAGLPEFYVLAVLLGLASILVISRANPTVSALAVAGIAFFVAIRASTILLSPSGMPPVQTTTNLGEVVTIAFLALAAGWIGAANRTDPRVIRTPYLLVAVVAAVGAIIENVNATRWFEDENLIGYAGRAYVGQQHPITLGLLLAVGIAMLFGVRARWRIIPNAILLAGVFATGSEGPIAIGIALTVAVTLPGVTRWVARHTRLLVIVSLAALGWLIYATFFVWTTALNDASIDQYSAGYRGALFSILPGMLAQNPLGYGPDGMPPNTYFIYSTYRGIRDMSLSLDSEPVYLAAQIGVFAIIIYLAVYFLGVFTLRRAVVPGLMLLALTIGGLLVALHAWLSVTAVVAGVAGCCIAIMRQPTTPDSADEARVEPRRTGRNVHAKRSA